MRQLSSPPQVAAAALGRIGMRRSIVISDSEVAWPLDKVVVVNGEDEVRLQVVGRDEVGKVDGVATAACTFWLPYTSRLKHNIVELYQHAYRKILDHKFILHMSTGMLSI